MMLEELYGIVDEIYHQPEAEPFCEPVNWKELNLPLYPQIIKKPMDLGTIRSKHKNNYYRNEKEMISDIRQVWINCMIFNQNGNDLYMLGNNYAEYFEKRIHNIRRRKHLRATDPEAIPSHNEKKQLHKNLLELEPDSLGFILSYISENSPDSLNKIPEMNDTVEVNIDMISPSIFYDVLHFTTFLPPFGEQENPPLPVRYRKKSRKR